MFASGALKTLAALLLGIGLALQGVVPNFGVILLAVVAIGAGVLMATKDDKKSTTAATTSPADSGMTTAAGRWSTDRFQATRAAS